MKELFLEVLKLSLSASLFVAAVVLLRLIFRKAPKWVFCALWAVVALRLVLPVNIQTQVSLVPDEIAQGQLADYMNHYYVEDVDIHHEGTPMYQYAVEAGRQPVGDMVITQQNSLKEPASLASVFSWVWLAGVAVMLGYTIVSVWMLRRKLMTATLLRDNIRRSEQVDSPFVLGLLRPVIYLPYRMDTEDMAYVVAHEQSHIQRRDHWWKPLGFLLLSIHWFNPVLWVAYILLCRDIEAACDEKVIAAMSREELQAYSRALLHCSIHRRRIAACPLAFGETGVKARIKSVMHYKKPAFWVILVTIVASVVAAVLLLTAPREEQPEETTLPTTQQTDPTTYPSEPDASVDVPLLSGRYLLEQLLYTNKKQATTLYQEYRVTDQGYLFAWDGKDWALGDEIGQLELSHEAFLALCDYENGWQAEFTGKVASVYGMRSLFDNYYLLIKTQDDQTLLGYGNLSSGLQYLYRLSWQPSSENETADGDAAETVFGWVDTLVESMGENLTMNPFTALSNYPTCVEELKLYGDAAVDILVTELENAAQEGPRERIMAALAAELTGIGSMNSGQKWNSSVSKWLTLYYQETGKTIGTMEEQIGASVGVDGNLFGFDNVWMRYDNIRQDEYQLGHFFYTVTFWCYQDKAHQKPGDTIMELLTVEFDQMKAGDFDGDGNGELFVAMTQPITAYYLYDMKNGKVREEKLEIVPQEILDYALLMDSGLYLPQEKWLRFIAEPEMYIRQMAMRDQGNIYAMGPNGGLPKSITDRQFQNAYQKLIRMLDTAAEKERRIIYRVLLELDFNCAPQTAVKLTDNDYGKLLAKWSYSLEGSSEELRCFDQLLYLLEKQPVAWLQAMAAADWNGYSRGYESIVRWVMNASFGYDKNTCRKTVQTLVDSAATEAEKSLAYLMLDLYYEWSAPWDRNTLLSADAATLWNALSQDTEGFIKLLGGCTMEQVKQVTQTIYYGDMPAQQNRVKCYNALLAMSFANMKETEEYLACRIMIELELWGGQKQTYTPGKAFDFYKLFTKAKYSDGAYSDMCASQFAAVFRQIPEQFLNELAAWEGDQGRMIDLLKYGFMGSQENETWLKETASGIGKNTRNETVKELVDAILEG